ncbi:hypothetical protein KB973_004707 [Vibrio parahaemolyticus]|uniref:hypothetical protein n=1 Tax=Vibrio TaxID=662 RepID=UPI0009C7F891|nr:MULTISPECIES: hypothetical protein [Vibrio]EGQ8062094.1 hypothetical protein [Vibrio parahaemolyticus]EHH1037797.1 hypothetical protein [Vibrio parahaemolyticus]EHH1251669.1 hypothetical protein [Vibrio parahaemolyticus]EHH2552298.1 hypothetical protein [Vibrio parahaemolyticus]EHH3642017.1 hypothetical protein [Vibrio parahaemolyticus]
MTEKRKKPSDPDVAQLLVATRRRCCLCYFLENDERRKKVQIAHINQKRSDSDVSNLVPLCLDHHDEYDSKTRQSKNITVHELKMYKEMLIKKLSSEEPQKEAVYVVEQRVPDMSSSIFYDYGNLYFDICIALLKYDPVGINFGVNPDEYAPEVHQIIARLQDNPNGLATFQICKDVFVDLFDEEIVEGVDFSEIADYIERRWERFLENNNVYE